METETTAGVTEGRRRSPGERENDLLSCRNDVEDEDEDEDDEDEEDEEEEDDDDDEVDVSSSRVF